MKQGSHKPAVSPGMYAAPASNRASPVQTHDKSLESREYVGIRVPLERLHHGSDLARRLLPAAAAVAALVLPHVGDEQVPVLVHDGHLARVGQADLVQGDLRYLLSEMEPSRQVCCPSI